MQLKGYPNLRIFDELGIESMKFRRWFRQLCVFYKIKTTQTPKYLYELLPTELHTYNTCCIENVGSYCCRTDLFKCSFFLYVVVEWNKPDISYFDLIFWNLLLKTGRPIQNPIYNTHHPKQVCQWMVGNHTCTHSHLPVFI